MEKLDLPAGSAHEFARVTSEVTTVSQTQLHRFEAMLPVSSRFIGSETMFKKMKFPTRTDDST